MDNITQQNTSLVEEDSAAAASLEDQEGKLTQAVSAFRLHNAPSRPVTPFSPAPGAGDGRQR